jgi:hypothetical protein
MATITKWSNVAIAMQSALGADLTISGITLAAPGVVTSTAHGLVNGDYVVFDISNGMRQIHDKVYRVASKANDTFQLEDVSGGTGVDTTGFDAFTSRRVLQDHLRHLDFHRDQHERDRWRLRNAWTPPPSTTPSAPWFPACRKKPSSSSTTCGTPPTPARSP